MNRILITGADSFVGSSFQNYLAKWPDKYQVDTLDMRDNSWRDKDFSSYDVIYHVAGIAHADKGKISAKRVGLYREVNTELTIETAKKAKKDGVKQFIFMSSAIVYGDSSPIGKEKLITVNTIANPVSFYGDSKLQAEIGLDKLRDDAFKVVIIRSPMIYGRGCKGNFPTLESLADKMRIFPYVENARSMIYIGNLVEFVRLMIENSEDGLFWPQNSEWSNTSEVVKMIAEAKGKKIKLVKGLGWVLKFLGIFTGLVQKAFGNLTYDLSMSEYKEDYRKYSLEESIRETVLR